MKRVIHNQIITVSLTIIAAVLLVERGHAAPNSPPGPDVRVVNTATNPVPVVIVNPTNKPVLVRSVDSSTLQPVQFRSSLHMDQGEGHSFNTIYTVPAGKRLVIEYVSFFINAPPGQNVVLAFVAITNAGGGVAGLLPTAPHLNGNLTGIAFFSSSELVKAYVEAGAEVSATVDRDGTSGTAGADVTVSGYLVDVP